MGSTLIARTLSGGNYNTRKSPREKIGIPLLSFLLIFPGFYIYQNIVFAEWISPLVGGGFTFLSAMCLPVLVVAYSLHDRKKGEYHRKRKKYSLPERLFFVFLLIFSTHIAFGLAFGKNEEITFSHLASLVQLTSLYLLARLLPVESEKVRMTMRWSLILLISITLLNISNLMNLTVYDYDLRINYQAAGFTFLAVTMFAMLSFSPWRRLPMMMLSIVVFFILGARTELLAFFLMMVLIIYFQGRIDWPILLTIILPVLGMFLLGVMYGLYHFDSDNRFFSLLELKEDRSYIERTIALENALLTIWENPILGDYASYEPGSYAHNILSTWVDLGLAGILVLCWLLIVLAMRIIKDARRFSGNITYLLSAINVLVVIFMLLSAKTYVYPLIGVAVGLAGRHYERL
jgi:hypothetical protein